MICLDANIWVSFLDRDLTEHEAVNEPVSTLLANRPLFTPTVVQMEVVHYLAKQLADSQEEIDRFLHIEDTSVAPLDARDVSRAATFLREYKQTGIGGRDAAIVATMERREVNELWTHDAGLKRLGEELGWLDVVDPVEDSG